MPLSMESTTKILKEILHKYRKGVSEEPFTLDEDIEDEMFGDQLLHHPLIKELYKLKKLEEFNNN